MVAATDSIRLVDRFPAAAVVARRFGVEPRISRRQAVVVVQAVGPMDLTAKAVWVAVLPEAQEETEARPWAGAARNLRAARADRRAVVREPNIKAATVRLEATTTRVVAVAVGMVAVAVATTLRAHTVVPVAAGRPTLHS